MIVVAHHRREKNWVNIAIVQSLYCFRTSVEECLYSNKKNVILPKVKIANFIQGCKEYFDILTSYGPFDIFSEHLWGKTSF